MLSVWERQRLQENRVNNAENSGVSADAEREGEYGNRSEAPRLAQHAQTKAQILYKVLNPIYASRVTALLFGLLDPAQVQPRPPSRFLGRYPFGDVFLGFSFEVIEQLVLQFPIK